MLKWLKRRIGGTFRAGKRFARGGKFLAGAKHIGRAISREELFRRQKRSKRLSTLLEMTGATNVPLIARWNQRREDRLQKYSDALNQRHNDLIMRQKMEEERAKGNLTGDDGIRPRKSSRGESFARDPERLEKNLDENRIANDRAINQSQNGPGAEKGRNGEGGFDKNVAKDIKEIRDLIEEQNKKIEKGEGKGGSGGFFGLGKKKLGRWFKKIPGAGKIAAGAGGIWAASKAGLGKILGKAGSLGKGILGKGVLDSAKKAPGILQKGFRGVVGMGRAALSKIPGAVHLGAGMAGKIGSIGKMGGGLLKGIGGIGKGILGKGGQLLSKIGMKGLGKGAVKKIPLIGALAGLGFGANRAFAGDWKGAGAEVLSGLASTVPGIGTGASMAIDAGLMARDAMKSPITDKVGSDKKEENKKDNIDAIKKAESQNASEESKNQDEKKFYELAMDENKGIFVKLTDDALKNNTLSALQKSMITGEMPANVTASSNARPVRQYSGNSGEAPTRIPQALKKSSVDPAFSKMNGEIERIATVPGQKNFAKGSTGNGQLSLSDQDIIDIMKVASTEVVGSLKGKAYDDQVGGVVDTILNRSYLKGGDVRGVLNERWAFSDINAPRASAYGSVQNVPMSRVSPRMRQAVLEHLRKRSEGMQSTVGGDVNYANPNFLGEASAKTKQWVREVEEQAKQTGQIYGSGNAIHVHGTPTGGKRAPEFKLNTETSSLLKKNAENNADKLAAESKATKDAEKEKAANVVVVNNNAKTPGASQRPGVVSGSGGMMTRNDDSTIRRITDQKMGHSMA